jgi:subtilase family serine protease
MVYGFAAGRPIGPDGRPPPRMEDKLMHMRRRLIIAAVAGSAAVGLCAGGVASAATAAAPAARWVALASTAPVAQHGARMTAMAAGSRVRVSVFTGRDLTGLAATALAVSDPSSPRYEHYLSPSQVRADYGATAAQQRAVGGWLAGAGLTVTHRDPFVVSATGTVAQAETAVRAGLELSHPRGGVEQVISGRELSVPASVAGAVATVRLSTAVAPLGQHEPMPRLTTAAAGSTIHQECSAYYGQKKAVGVPAAFGKTLDWAPCGYLPQQVRDAYGAGRSGLTGSGVSIAILTEDNDSTALGDANRWARARHFPPFKPGQFTPHIATDVPSGIGDGESALDIESVHGMAPGAKVNYVAGNGSITGDRLLDAMDTVVTYRMADVVSSSWFEGYMPVPKSMINAWETVLERAAVEGITVNFATGDFGDETPLQYPGSDPWITTVGGTSLAIGARSNYIWETAWETDEAGLSTSNTHWVPPAPGRFAEGSTGGISAYFPEPYYQEGVVTGNVVNGQAMRAVPDVADLGDWNLGYQIGLTVIGLHHKREYINAVNGGTSLASPLFTGFEADLVQGRGGISLGFANPALYEMAGTAAFHAVTGNPQGQGVTEADVFGPAYGEATRLSAMGQCASTDGLTCGPGYSTATGIGSPGPRFFSSFGSHPR